MKGALEVPEDCNLKLAEERAAGEAGGPRRLKRIADAWNTAGLGGAKEGTRDAREEVRVLVRVDVGDGEALLLEGPNLGGSFVLYIRFRDAATLEVEDEPREGGAKAIAGGERGNVGCRG